MGTSFHPSDHASKLQSCVKRKFGHLQKINVLPKLQAQKILLHILIVETSYQLHLKKVDARSMINWTIVDEQS